MAVLAAHATGPENNCFQYSYVRIYKLLIRQNSMYSTCQVCKSDHYGQYRVLHAIHSARSISKLVSLTAPAGIACGDTHSRVPWEILIPLCLLDEGDGHGE